MSALTHVGPCPCLLGMALESVNEDDAVMCDFNLTPQVL